MPCPGDLLQSADYAFAFRTLERAPESPRRLLVLLHGVGGEESQLASAGARMPAGTVVVLPRAQRSISGGRRGWFREGLSADGPQVVEDEEEEARRKLVDFAGQVQSRFDVPPARTVLAGFSQGGMLAAAAALTAPACTAGFAMLCGRVMPELEPRIAPPDALAHLQALVVHGRRDQTLPAEWAGEADARLATLGVEHVLRLHDAGHELTPAMERDLVDWYADPARPWMR